MRAEERRVWDAIYAALNRHGDADIRAGIAWITDEEAALIARAAIEATVLVDIDAWIASLPAPPQPHKEG